MNDNVILLTFETIQGYNTYNWFKNIDEVNEFIKEYGDSIRAFNECVDTTGAIEIDLTELGS